MIGGTERAANERTAASDGEVLRDAFIALAEGSGRDPATVIFAMTDALANFIVLGHDDPPYLVDKVAYALRTIVGHACRGPGPGESTH